MNAMKNMAGLGMATWMGKMARDDSRESINKIRRARGLKDEAYEPAPIDKAIDWFGEKFKALKTPSNPAATASPASTPDMAPAGESVGLWDRLKAGNIDAPGSEAYDRWGQGKKDGNQRVSDFESDTRPAFDNTPAAFTAEDFANAPSANEVADAKMNAFVEDNRATQGIDAL